MGVEILMRASLHACTRHSEIFPSQLGFSLTVPHLPERDVAVGVGVGRQVTAIWGERHGCNRTFMTVNILQRSRCHIIESADSANERLRHNTALKKTTM